jgi:hypothetical protein
MQNINLAISIEPQKRILNANFDGFVKSLQIRFSVIPAQAGIQSFHVVRILWIPVFTGMTTFCEIINFAMLILQ